MSALKPGKLGAEAELRGFIEKFSPEDQRLIRAVRKAMRKRLPTAHELVWDNYNFFVIGYSPTERPSDSLLSIFARASALGICFINGARLRDPKGILRGSVKQVRSIRVESVGQLSDPDVEALIHQSVSLSKTPFPASGKGKLIIR